jgi:hypothetical protein
MRPAHRRRCCQSGNHPSAREIKKGSPQKTLTFDTFGPPALYDANVRMCEPFQSFINSLSAPE